MILGSSGGERRCHSRSAPNPANKASLDGRQPRLLKLAPLSKAGREEGGPRIPALPPPSPHRYPITSSINLTLEPSPTGLSSHPVDLGLSRTWEIFSAEEGPGRLVGREQGRAQLLGKGSQEKRGHPAPSSRAFLGGQQVLPLPGTWPPAGPGEQDVTLPPPSSPTLTSGGSCPSRSQAGDFPAPRWPSTQGRGASHCSPVLG